MKFKNLLIIFAASVFVLSCNNDSNSSSNFDAEEQAKLDDEALIEYLQTHYLNDVDGGLWTIKDGEDPLFNDARLATENLTKNDIAYKLYYLKLAEGTEGDFPSRADSVLTTYTGMLLDSTVFDSRSNSIWFALTNVIDGWGYGFKNFKGGVKTVDEFDHFEYSDQGKGILFIPSGLAYANIGQNSIPPNKPLIFEFNLNAVHKADHDNDGILSIDEDLDKDGDVKNDDSDGDNIMNYLDTDDDNDGVLTKDEDTNGDGDYSNDDADNDGTPDYLDPDKV